MHNRDKAKPHNRDVNAALRAEQAMQLRKLGATYQQIAQQCGYSGRAAAYTAVQRELGRTLQDSADSLRKIEAERLDDLYRVMVSKALKGDAGCVDRCLRIMERRASLLGLDVKPDDAAASALPVVREYPSGTTEAV